MTTTTVDAGATSRAARRRVWSSRVSPPTRWQNCLGRSSPARARVRARTRSPSPPARMMQESVGSPLVIARLDTASRARDSLAALLQQLGDERRPPRLVAGPDASTVVPVKVLVEQEQIPPVRVVLEGLRPAEDRSAAVGVPEEDPGEPARQLGGHLPQVQPAVGSGGERHRQLVSVEVVEALQRLDEQVVHGKPDRTAPVGIAPEEAAGGLRRLVVDP